MVASANWSCKPITASLDSWPTRLYEVLDSIDAAQINITMLLDVSASMCPVQDDMGLIAWILGATSMTMSNVNHVVAISAFDLDSERTNVVQRDLTFGLHKSPLAPACTGPGEDHFIAAYSDASEILTNKASALNICIVLSDFTYLPERAQEMIGLKNSLIKAGDVFVPINISQNRCSTECIASTHVDIGHPDWAIDEIASLIDWKVFHSSHPPHYEPASK